LAGHICDFIATSEIQPQSIIGVPEGANKIAISTSLTLASRKENLQKGDYMVPLARRTPKEHGAPEDRHFIGIPQGKTIVIEDVVSSGGSLRAFLQRLQALEVEVSAVLVLVNRLDSVQALKEALGVDIPVLVMSQGKALLNNFLESSHQTSAIQQLIAAELAVNQ
jgi:orotate phosphoribosyltransferase